MPFHTKIPGAVLLVGSVLMAAGCGAGTSADPDVAVASTEYGLIDGYLDDEVMRWEGVPYAEAPLGEYRLAPPREIAPWEGRLRATSPAEPCVQPTGDEVSGSENCLYLNVTAPAARSIEPRPVMVWLHGGGFEEGSAMAYDPRRLALQGDVVVITVGFRLGALGLLAFPGLEGGGTFGLLDQIEALRFVQRTAVAFGGNPGNVTLFGESAGGTAVCHLIASPATDGLLHRAIIQSAPECGAPAPPNAYSLPYGDGPGYVEPSMLRADVQARGIDAVSRLGCAGNDTLECLRSLDAAAFLDIHREFTLPAIDTELSPVAPIQAFDSVSVPVLAGYTRDESRYFAILGALLGEPWPAGSFESAIRDSFPDQSEQILGRYPLTLFADDASAWGAVYTDATFACPQLHANDVLSSNSKVYAYEFADRTAASPLPLLAGAPEPGASHSAELPYLFDMDAQPIDITGEHIPLTAPQEQLASEMIDVWSGFARTGIAPVAAWAEAGHALEFSERGVGTIDPGERHQCEFWNASR